MDSTVRKRTHPDDLNLDETSNRCLDEDDDIVLISSSEESDDDKQYQLHKAPAYPSEEESGTSSESEDEKEEPNLSTECQTLNSSSIFFGRNNFIWSSTPNANRGTEDLKVETPEVVKKKRRCAECPSRIGRMSKLACVKCRKPTCKEHSVVVCRKCCD
ncbi:hypothetical protein CHUAL_009740 [Chamberlinius hualienensis]